MPDRAMQVAAVIGDPVVHSLSPVIHNAAFAATGFAATFLALPVRSEDLPAAIAGARAFGFLGLSVTMPHKAAVVGLVDEVDGDAAALEAVNCVARAGTRLVGTNTDGAGFVDALRAGGVDLAGARVLVLGAGGAARAVIRALPGAGVAEVGVANRSADRGAAAIALGGETAHTAAGADAPDYDIVVNATSVGMGVAAADGVLPLPEDRLRPGHVVVDLVYEPVETGLLAAARQGATVVDGVGMLVHQAAHAFARWTELPAPVDVMTAAARAALDAET